MLDALTGLELPHGSLAIPAIGLDAATMISYGRVAAPNSTASFGHRQHDHLHVAPDEAIEYDTVVSRFADVAAEGISRARASPRSCCAGWLSRIQTEPAGSSPLGKPRFTWQRDGEALLRRYKTRFLDRSPLPGVTPLSNRQRAFLRP